MVADYLLSMKGNILDSTADYIVIPVNCVGAMGAGLARQAKERWPDLEREYQEALRNGVLHMNKPSLVYIQHRGTNPQYAVLFPTKFHYRDKTKPQWIVYALRGLNQEIAYGRGKSIAFPKVGCGLGGLNWEKDVRPFVNEWAGYRIGVKVIVYE